MKEIIEMTAEEAEYMENERLYNEFKELAEDGELEDEEHFTITDITEEVKAWIEKDDYEARQILDDAVPTKDGFQVVGWQWAEDADTWTLTAELEY